jgi:hypothetical protein
MKLSIIGLCLFITVVQPLCAQIRSDTTSKKSGAGSEEELINLSGKKWIWMAQKKADTLANLFHEKAVFVHMGGSWGTAQELNIIRSGGIHYKKADIHEVSVNILDNTAILLSRITLLAVVEGNEVTNPFMVTEVYVRQYGKWMLGSLSFTRLLVPPGQRESGH